MRIMTEEGLTLVELLMAIAIFGLIAAGATSLLSASLGAQAQGEANYKLYQEGLIIMERLTSEVKTTTYLLIPNAHTATRDILAISGNVNEDNDYYFGDPLFPRIDEDPDYDMNLDNQPGLSGIDDDGNGVVDDGGDKEDDDEDGTKNEDPLDGIDNDGDGNIDEDFNRDANGDEQPGIAGMDDDGNGAVDDSGDKEDDDEDGAKNEDPLNPVIYSYDSGTSTLQVSDTYSAQTVVLSTRVSAFQVTYEAPQRILITLTLTGDDGEPVTFSETVHLENTYQKLGKRVR
jgi:prepilin-type N-terminal cleavage/methylation domain-containing protein